MRMRAANIIGRSVAEHRLLTHAPIYLCQLSDHTPPHWSLFETFDQSTHHRRRPIATTVLCEGPCPSGDHYDNECRIEIVQKCLARNNCHGRRCFKSTVFCEGERMQGGRAVHIVVIDSASNKDSNGGQIVTYSNSLLFSKIGSGMSIVD